MVNTALLKSKLKAKDLRQEDAAKMLGINPSTFNKKVNNALGNNITVREAEMLGNILEIPKHELSEIFFAEKLA